MPKGRGFLVHPAAAPEVESYTLSHRRYRFGCAPSYLIYGLIRCPSQEAQALIQNIHCGVGIPVMNLAALRADPLPNAEVPDFWILVAAATAKLAAWEACPDFNNSFVLPFRLIFELAGKLAPGAVGNGLGQVMVLHHVADIKTLYADDIVLPNQLRGHLMQVVLPLVGNLFVLSGKADAGLLTVLAVLWFSGQPSLQPNQLLLRRFKPLGVKEFLAIRGDDQILDTYIQTHSFPCTGQLGDFNLGTANAHEEFAAPGHTHCGRKDVPHHGCRNPGLDPSQLWKLYSSVLNSNAHLGGIAVFAAVLCLESGESGSLTLGQLSEEVLICPVDIGHSGLQGCRIHFPEPGIFVLHGREHFNAVIIAQGGLVFGVCLLPYCQYFVVNEAGAAERFEEQDFLFFCRVQPEFIGFLHRESLLS